MPTEGLHVTPDQLAADREFFLRLRSVATAAGYFVAERQWSTAAKLIKDRLGKRYARYCDDHMIRASIEGLAAQNPTLFQPALFGSLQAPADD
jgi:hypothetical protein